MTTYIEKGNNCNIKDDKSVKVTLLAATGKVRLVATSNENKHNLSKYRNLPGGKECVNTETGEIVERTFNEFQSEKSIKRKMKKLKNCIECNFSGADNELFITLTYNEKCYSIESLKADFKSFFRRLNYTYKNLGYVYVIESHAKNDGYHIHCMLKDCKNNSLYIPNKVISEIWQHGHTVTKHISNKKSKVEINEKKVEKQPDGFLANIHYFGIDKVVSYMCKSKSKMSLPAGARIFEVSRNLLKPKTKKINCKEICDLLLEKGYIKKEAYTALIKSTKTDAILAVIQQQDWVPNDVKITELDLLNLIYNTTDMRGVEE